MNPVRTIREPLKRWRRNFCELLGIARYSRPSLNALDRKLERYLDFDGGFFVEAGANDGFEQSNTYYFEKLRGWTGVLVEPVPMLAAECRKNRRSRVIQAALTATDEPGKSVELHYSGLMSTVTGALGDADMTSSHVKRGIETQRLSGSYRLKVPARTLSAVLDEAQVTRTIDLLSLDVEGSESAALSGLDFGRHAPRFICVESRNDEAICRLLGSRYRLVEILTDLGGHRDLLFNLR